MARRTFFSFHYNNDVWRASNVRNSWVVKGEKDAAGFVDYADFEAVKKKGDAAVKAWIRDQLDGTSVTVVLIGSQTCNRDYVKYELQQSYSKGNGLLGIYIDGIKDSSGNTSIRGSNMFGEIGKDPKGNAVYFSVSYPCYDWVAENGRANMGAWIEAAAKRAGR